MDLDLDLSSLGLRSSTERPLGALKRAAAATPRLSYLTKLADELADSRHDAAADAARRA